LVGRDVVQWRRRRDTSRGREGYLGLRLWEGHRLSFLPQEGKEARDPLVAALGGRAHLVAVIFEGERQELLLCLPIAIANRQPFLLIIVIVLCRTRRGERVACAHILNRCTVSQLARVKEVG
jgi:hypothetical protein